MSMSRRQFLKTSGYMSAAVGAAATPFALNLSLAGSAAAQSATDYKALVCVFLYGGNDSFNTVLATDTASWAQYKRWRDLGQAPLSLPGVGQAGGVIPIVPRTVQSGRAFALNPKLADVARLFDAGRVAVVSNVGPITGPLDLRDYNTGVSPFLPASLFSHNDQQSIWQSQKPEGASFGWGGRMGDLIASANGDRAVFTALSASGSATWLAGQDIIQYQLSRDGAVPVNALQTANAREQAIAAIMRRIVRRDSAHLLEKEVAKITRRSLDTQDILRASLLPRNGSGVPDPTQLVDPVSGDLVDNPLAVQLQTVARIIGGRNALGVRRQVFFVGMGGFDTHSDQPEQHLYLMQQLNHGMQYFDTQLGNIGGADLRSQVTLFTASDFGRTFTSNGNGTDHGFGAHHLVMGGAVRGQDIYGQFPASGIGHERDYGKGVLLPQFSVDQYAATMARWFGLNDGQLAEVFPNLSRFPTADLGFIGKRRVRSRPMPPRRV
jgi:uncharacterized protein (DUF1501 family)